MYDYYDCVFAEAPTPTQPQPQPEIHDPKVEEGDSNLLEYGDDDVIDDDDDVMDLEEDVG